MLSDQEKKEMLADAQSRERKKEFLSGARTRANNSKKLNDYISFLKAAQKIKAFQHLPVVTPDKKNIL
jgi:hypothetical protein